MPASARLRALLALILTVFPLFARSAEALTIRENTWVIDGPVNAITTLGDTLYLGGQFNRIGPPTGCFAAFDATGSALAWPTVHGQVNAILPDGQGGWYLGGSFSSVSGQPRYNLARVDSNGGLLEWAPFTDGAVNAMTVSGRILY